MANSKSDDNGQILQIDLVLPGDRAIEHMGNESPILRRYQRTARGVLPVKLRDDYVIGTMSCFNEYCHV